MLKASYGVLFYFTIVHEVIAFGHIKSRAVSSSISLACPLGQFDIMCWPSRPAMYIIAWPEGQQKFEDSKVNQQLKG